MPPDFRMLKNVRAITQQNDVVQANVIKCITLQLQ